MFLKDFYPEIKLKNDTISVKIFPKVGAKPNKNYGNNKH